METSVVYLTRGDDPKQAVEAVLCDDITPEHVELWRATWKPLTDELVARLTRENVPIRDWPQDLHWKWDRKTDWSRSKLALRRCALLCEKNLQGLMLLNLAKFAREKSQFGKDLTYVEFVATAPWNRPKLTGLQKFGTVGTVFMRAAIEMSRAETFRGRIALHSLPQSDSFYRDNCGMTDLGPDPDYPGKLRYFEMTETQADAFCLKKNHP